MQRCPRLFWLGTLVVALVSVAAACRGDDLSSEATPSPPADVAAADVLSAAEMSDYAARLGESVHYTLAIGIQGGPDALTVTTCVAEMLVQRYGADPPQPGDLSVPKPEIWAAFDDEALDVLINAIRECKPGFDERYSTLLGFSDTYTDEHVECVAAAQLADDGALMHQLIVASLRDTQDLPESLLAHYAECGVFG